MSKTYPQAEGYCNEKMLTLRQLLPTWNVTHKLLLWRLVAHFWQYFRRPWRLWEMGLSEIEALEMKVIQPPRSSSSVLPVSRHVNNNCHTPLGSQLKHLPCFPCLREYPPSETMSPKLNTDPKDLSSYRLSWQTFFPSHTKVATT